MLAASAPDSRWRRGRRSAPGLTRFGIVGLSVVLLAQAPATVWTLKVIDEAGEPLPCRISVKTAEGVPVLPADDPVTLVLGDNIFYGHGLARQLRRAAEQDSGSTVFAYHVSDPERYGVVHFDEDGNALGIEEKPAHPKSSYAVTGLYFYDNDVVDLAKSLRPSMRGELEISDLNQLYLERGSLKVEVMGRGVAWLDTGTHDSLMQASQFIQVIEKRQGLKIGCIEEEAYKMGFINKEQLEKLGEKYLKSGYGEYLLGLLK